ncbi:MAG: leucine-rich repeat domain-containing protein [Acutalibacteraceae bacterium]|nr:leucine-rich repeat domain-containing protein [Acutalibacteraceae bacterium]
MIFTVMPFSAFTVSALTSEYYTYTISSGEATITDVDESISGDIIIPSELGGYPVTIIGEYAFDYCDNIESICIQNSITSIGRDAFAYCYGLNSVTIGDSVISIGDWAFYYCYNLKSEHSATALQVSVLMRFGVVTV